jgi:selenide,water dikinase
LLVGLGSPDDAAVWRLDDGQALVVTTDFFTPIVDDPYAYGAIAAANALSDLYAMGAKPFMALNVAAMPGNLPPDVLQAIFRGGAEKVREAGAVVAGGHTVRDDEPKYGLVALGLCAPEQLMTKGAAKAGQILFLTKPLGFGVTTTALKAEKAEASDVEQAIDWMTRLNAQASTLASRNGVRAATDVTGFSLLGHALEMAHASQARLRVYLGSIPLLAGARGYCRMGFYPSGSEDNRRHYGPHVRFESGIDEVSQRLLFDAQTSGGLLISVPPEQASHLAEAARADGIPVWPIGDVAEGAGLVVQLGRFEAPWHTGGAEIAGIVFAQDEQGR